MNLYTRIAPDSVFFIQKFQYFSYFSTKNIYCWYSLEVSHQDVSNEYTQTCWDQLKLT